MITDDESIAESSSPHKIFKARSLQGFFYEKALSYQSKAQGCQRTCDLFQGLRPDVFAMKMLLHLFYVNPDRCENELENFNRKIPDCRKSNKSVAKQMVRLSNNDLPIKYRSCLLYLSIFPENDCIRRTTVTRRWRAEGLITERDHIAIAMDRSVNHAQDEAERCFDALVARRLVLPGEISAAGKIKSCTIHRVVRQVITRIATDVNFVDTDLPPDLSRHLSIHNRIGLQASHFDHPLEADGNGIVAYLPYLAKSSQWQLLKVLDLEGCKGLTKKHLKSICKILLLKYLSLRKTDVTELPKQIEKLQCLETLDIRQTVVRAFATKSVMLPMLKHLLAGQIDSPSIRIMKKLEILSHVDVSHNVDDLIDLVQLLQLRKLGVIIHRKKGALDLLFKQIAKLCGCLRSLSIRIAQPARSESTLDAEAAAALASHPELLQSLNISGITSGLPLWIADLDELTKITLSQTYLGEDAIRILGKLKILSCLRLHRQSYTGREISFKKEEFRCFKSLVVEGSDITTISFDAGAAPELEMIVWSFPTMESLSGVYHLRKLRKLELNGDCNQDHVEQLRKAIQKHRNHPDFKHNPHHPRQEDGIAVAAAP